MFARLFLAAICALLASRAASASNEIILRLSYKVLVNPANGTRPPGATDAAIDSAIAEMNSLLLSYGRGYRFQRVVNSIALSLTASASPRAPKKAVAP